ncbi:helix-turn-helix transcriptional regulator [candidate division KSB1 bacterium]|nr:helix-turn-helix transcriptional regulator [candidate division KSB1 bacterium]
MKVKRTVIQEDFNKFLSREMKAKGLSIRKLASKAGISASYLSHLKTFKTVFPLTKYSRK